MFANISRSNVSEKSAVISILAGGVVARLIWVLGGKNSAPLMTESHNVAVSLARTGRFAGAFGPDSGPTAHISMLTPIPSAAAYFIFGVDTPAAEFALSLWAAAIVSVGFFLCWRLAKVLEIAPMARVAAILFVALVPLQFGLEMVEGRSWEANLAVVFLIWMLLRLAQAQTQSRVDGAGLAVTGAISGFLTIINPPAGLASALAGALFLWLRVPRRQWRPALIGFVAVAGLCATVWAARNMAQMGGPIALRDNLGLELALSNYPGAVHPADAHAAYLARMRAIHPLGFGNAIGRLRAAGGERLYYAKMDSEFRAYVAAHPGDFLRMCARRFVQFYFPPRWFWGTFGDAGKLIWLRQFLVWATALTGLVTAGIMAGRHRAYVYVTAVSLGCSIAYIFVQPTLRYRYLISSLLIFMAFDGLAKLYGFVTSQQEIVLGSRKLSSP